MEKIVINTNRDIDDEYPKTIKKESDKVNVIKHPYDRNVIIDKKYIYLPGERDYGYYGIYRINDLPIYCNVCGRKIIKEKEKHIYHYGFDSQSGKPIYKSFLQINCYCPKEVVVNGEERYQFIHHRMFRKLEAEEKWYEYKWESCYLAID